VVGNEVKITIDMELTKPLAKAEGK
jgi:hypothetical protein